MKRKLIFKLFSFLSIFSVLFNSFYAPLYVLAQDQLEPTPTPVESLIIPVTTDSLISPTPAEDLTTPTPSTEVSTTSTPTNNLMTPAPTSIPRLTDEPTPLVSPSEIVLGEASQTTPIPSDNEITEGEEKLDVFVFENADAQDVESEILPDFDYRELSSATLTTDKFDYAPTDAVVITGSGFSPNTSYELVITSSTGNFRFSDSVVSNESGKFIYTYQLDGVYRPEYKVDVLSRDGFLLVSITFTDSETYCQNDVEGANDEPGQKDLTRMCYTPGSPIISTNWQWDEINWSGGNTGDACNLFDTDNDGKVNYALCVTVSGSPASIQTTTLYSCGDGKKDRCTNPISTVPYSSSTSCNVVIDNADPFPAGASYPQDTKASCNILLSDIGGVPASTKLIDVCSYPSQQPNSDPSDCIIATQSHTGKLEVVKKLNPSGDSGLFNLLIDGSVLATGVGDGGTTHEQVVLASSGSGTPHTFGETGYQNTDLSKYKISVECKDNDGTGSIVPVTGSNPWTVNVVKDKDIVCTITNTLNYATINILKLIDHDGNPNTSDDQTLPSFDWEMKIDTYENPSVPVVSGFTDESGTVQLTFVPEAGKQYKLSEVIPNGYQYLSGYCKKNNQSVGGSNYGVVYGLTISSGETFDCTFINSQRGSILVHKFEDLNANGQIDGQETGLAGWEMSLFEGHDCTENGLLTSGKTDDKGDLEFNDLLVGEYSVLEVEQSGWQNTTSLCQNVTVTPGATSRLNFGNVRYGSISGYKYEDVYANRTKDATDPVLPGWTVNLYDSSDVLVKSVQTDSNGKYAFGDLPSGTYKVCEVQQEGWIRTSPSTDCYENIVVSPGEDVENKNFGNYRLSSISGVKFEDLNGNGVRDEGEPGLEGWTIYLDINLNGYLDEGEPRTDTDSDGHYVFDNLTMGNYHGGYSIREVLKPGWVKTYPRYGANWAETKSGSVATGEDFGNFRLGEIRGRKYDDLNANGIRDSGESYLNGWAIRLYKEGEGWNLVDTKSTGHTGVSGQYKFEDLEPGRYKICEVLQDGWVQTAPTGSNNRVQSDEAPRCRVVNINVSGEVAGGRNFGNFKLGKIYGYKYDEDGQTRLNGWSIFIDEDGDRFFDEGEEVVQTGSSNEEWPSGYFEFTGLTAGNYSVCEVEQQGWQRMHPLGTNCQSVSVTSGSETEIYFQNREVVLGLALTKSNDAMGDLSAGSQVNYTLVIKNTGNQKLTGTVIKDAPAGGFTYVAGTGSLGGNPITPTINAGYLEWYIGVLGAGEEKILNYKLQTNSALVAGTYPNVAIATGVYIPSEYTASENSEELVFEPMVVEVLAVSEESEDEISGENVESNSGVPVNSEVRIAANLSYSTGVGSTGQVLGASTEVEEAVLPAAGSSTWNLLIAILSLLLGLGLKGLGTAVEENRINTKRVKKGFEKISAFLASLSLFLVLSSSVRAFSDYAYITKLSPYLNKDNFYLSYSALSENPITAQFYVRKDGDSTWRTLGSDLSGASGQVEVKSSDIYGGDAKYFFKVVINGGTASDETSTTIDRSAPDPVSDYWKEKVGDGHYKLHWRNPNNSDYDRVKIYRSENKNFTADSSTEIATLWGTAGSEMTSENAAAPGKEYYFAIRAIDKAGNASVVVADPETQVTAGAVLGESTIATPVPKAEAVKLLPKETKKGEVLGEEKVEEKTPSPKISSEEKEQLGGVLGQAINFAKDRTGLALIVALALGVVSYFISNYFKKSK